MLKSGSTATARVPSGGCSLPAQAHRKSWLRFHGSRSEGNDKQRSRTADKDEKQQEL